MSTVDILKDTKKLLLNKGWCQGRSVDDDGRHCLLGALSQVAPGSAYITGYESLYRAINAKYPGEGVASFNDDIAKTVDDVIALIDDSIATVA